MIVKSYGTRGSVPVSGKNKSKYGGNTTCWRVRSQRVDPDTEIIVDGGSGLIPLTEDLNVGALRKVTLLFTHYHLDHINGLGLSSFMYIKKIRKQVFGPVDQGKGPMEALQYAFQKPYFPVTDERIKSSFTNLMENGIASNHVLCFTRDLCTSLALSEYERTVEDPGGQVPFELEGRTVNYNLDEVLFVKSIEVAHPDRCVSYRFEEYVVRGEHVELVSCFVLLTDCEAQPAVPSFYAAHLNGANLVAVDCQYSLEDYETYAGFGHGNPDWVGRIAARTNARNIGIIHHDPHASDDRVDMIVTQCRSSAERLGANLSETSVFGVRDYSEFTL